MLKTDFVQWAQDEVTGEQCYVDDERSCFWKWFVGEEQAQDSELWSEEDFASWTKGRKGKKGLSKGNDGFQKGGFRPYQPDKGAGKDCTQNKGKGKYQKGKGKEDAHPQSGLSASEAPEEEGYSHAWESDD